MLALRVVCLLPFVVATAFAQLPHARQVAAPPEDILDGILALPDPAASATRSRSALVLCDFERGPGDWLFEHTLHLNPGEPLSVVPFGTHCEEWTISLRTPGNDWTDLADLVAAGHARPITHAMPGPADALPLQGVVVEPAALVGSSATGEWRLRVHAPRTRGDRAPGGRILLSGSGPLRLVSHVTTQRLVADQPIGVVAHLVDPLLSDAPVPGVVEQALLTLESGWGRLELPMHDDGLHADGAAGDGRFGALLPSGLSGDLRALATLVGRTADGEAIHLTGQHAFPVLEPALFLSGQVVARVVDERFTEFTIGAQLVRELDRLHVSAEVWGRPGTRAAVPVAWLSRMLQPQVSGQGAGATLKLTLDNRWLGRVGKGAEFTALELRQLRVQDPDTHAVFDLLDSVAVDVPRYPARALLDPGSITRDMLMGPSAAAPAPGADPRSLQGRGALMLVHGYCSGGSIWPPAHYDEPKIEFLDPDANRSHDQFAQLMLVRSSGLPSFGVVAHSQGGAAALHLLTYYASGLDQAHGPRRIQSLATPYQGTPLAAFGGFACGTNNDLTPGGAATWLAGIPAWARAEVYYWTTVDDGSACSGLANLILDFDDNDGTTERVRGQLPGATNMGHIPGWCHTTGMSDPPGYTDGVLNAVRNAGAAR